MKRENTLKNIVGMGTIENLTEKTDMTTENHTADLEPMEKTALELEDLSMLEIGDPLKCHFHIGELYLFSSSNSCNEGDDLMWGVFDKIVENRIYMESLSSNMSDFDLWCELPDKYKHYRLTTRRELRDYIMGLTYSQCASHDEFLMHF